MKLLLSLLLIVMSGVVQAEDSYDLKGRWGVGLGAGFPSVTGSDAFKSNGALDMDGNFSGGLWVRYHMTTRFAVELAYTRLSFGYESNTAPFNDLDPAVDVVDLNVAYRIWPVDRWHVLLQLGAGYARLSDLSAAGSGDDDFAMKFRTGVEFMASKDLMLSLYGDYHHINIGGGDNSELQTISPVLGITYYFGGKSEPEMVDSDGDGIADDMDKCPGTESAINVGSDGCPLKVDSDGDGVADNEDQCPGTPAGKEVTAYGCTKAEKVEFTLNVRFDVGRTNIDERYVSDLTAFAEFMKKFPDTTAQIEGHTDNTGKEKVNFRISESRAKAVRTYLIKKFSIDEKRLTAKGFGPSQPVADNKTKEGRAKNRRVVAHIKSTKKEGK